MRYCIGDVHGCIKTLDKLIHEIYKLDQNPKFYFVGDLIDRGPNSKAVLDLIMNMYQNQKAISVLGNHEAMMLNAYNKKIKVSESIWQQNGAEKTTVSFDPDANLQLSVNHLIPKNYITFIEKLPYYIELDDYLIVHAGFNFKSKSPFTDYESMVWTREEQYNPDFTKGKKIIHGHTPLTLEQVLSRIKNKNSNNINIDSGCIYVQYKDLGNLTVFNMDNRELLSVKNIDII